MPVGSYKESESILKSPASEQNTNQSVPHQHVVEVNTNTIAKVQEEDVALEIYYDGKDGEAIPRAIYGTIGLALVRRRCAAEVTKFH